MAGEHGGKAWRDSMAGKYGWCGACRAEGACTEDYYEADLALVRCYTCNRMGHLCCKGAPQEPPELSCHNCGDAGHLAVDCTSFRPPQVGETHTCFKV